jgi:hypothetical protein
MSKPQITVFSEYVVCGKDKQQLFAERVLNVIHDSCSNMSFRSLHGLSSETAGLLEHVCTLRSRDNVLLRMELLSILSNAIRAYQLWSPEMTEANKRAQSFTLPDIIYWFFKSGVFIGIDKRDSRWAAAIDVVATVANELLIRSESCELNKRISQSESCS